MRYLTGLVLSLAVIAATAEVSAAGLKDAKKAGNSPDLHCQFSWWCDGRSDEPVNRAAWKESLHVAKLIKKGVANDPTNGSLWYHAISVSPSWAKKLDRYARIGQHIFYTDPKRAPKQVADASLGGR